LVIRPRHSEVGSKPSNNRHRPLGINVIAIGCAVLVLTVCGCGDSDSGSSGAPASSTSAQQLSSTFNSAALGSSSSGSNTNMVAVVSSKVTCNPDFCTGVGKVKNVSLQSLSNVEVHVNGLDSSGNTVTQNDAMIDYNPILPNETSSFQVVFQVNPALKGVKFSFHYLDGGLIPVQQ
jgi:hypothetical protein